MSDTHRHLMTFDIEHWYEGYRHRDLGGWKNVPARDDLVVERLFELLRQYGHTATFFFTGRFAREFPHHVKACTDLGHEVASHSDQHRVIHRLASEAEFRDDLKASIDTLTHITGRPLLGYRAPKWSVSEGNQCWVLHALADAGLVYDSSFFPTLNCDAHRRRGVPVQVDLSDGRSIIEVPASGYDFGLLTLPVAGGLYFRMFPAWVTSAMLAQKQRSGAAGMMYVHPYDLDIDSPRIPGGSFLFRRFRSLGVAGAWRKLEALLARHKFTSIEQQLPMMKAAMRIDCRN